MKQTTSPKALALHPRNKHQGRYDFHALTKALPALATVTIANPHGEPTIDFSDRQSIILLNKALLAHHYAVTLWDIPEGYLCPAIPGRADYIHHLADLLTTPNHTTHVHSSPPTGKRIHALDIGTGASCIYPIIGSQSYGWKFTATDIDLVSVNTAKVICDANKRLKSHITVKHQPNAAHIFHGIIGTADYFDITLCNPPFHASLAAAHHANISKQCKLNRRKSKPNQQIPVPSQPVTPHLNFGGQAAELWCDGGEIAFLTTMVNDSQLFANQVGWFTTLVSKADNLPPLKRQLHSLGVTHMKTLSMRHGQKNTRILAWSFTDA